MKGPGKGARGLQDNKGANWEGVRQKENRKVSFCPAKPQPKEGFPWMSGCRKGCAMPRRSTQLT